MPVAQTFVLRRVLMGGISTNRCLVARTVVLVRVLPSGRAVERWWSGLVGGVWHTVGS